MYSLVVKIKFKPTSGK